MQLGQDAAHSGDENVQATTDQPASIDIRDQDGQPELAYTNTGRGDGQMETESSKRDDPPAEVEPSPKRARTCPTSAKLQLSREQDAMEN